MTYRIVSRRICFIFGCDTEITLTSVEFHCVSGPLCKYLLSDGWRPAPKKVTFPGVSALKNLNSKQ